MMESDVAAVLDKLGRAWNGEPRLVFEIFHSDFVNHTKWSAAPRGPQGIYDLILAVRTAFPDLKCVTEDWFHANGKVSVRVQFVGTHEGMYGDIPPTGRRCVWNANAVYHLRDGRIADEWSIAEEILLLDQLGMQMQTPARKDLTETQEGLLRK